MKTRSLFTYLFVLALSLAGPASAAAQTSSIVGTWTLARAEKLLPDGSRVSDYGPNPRGLAIFTADGYYSVHIYRAERLKFASGNKLKGTPEEYRDASLSMSDHFGRYEVDPWKGTITFHIDRASFPNWDDTSPVRSYELKGDELSWKGAPRPDGSVTITVLRRAAAQTAPPALSLRIDFLQCNGRGPGEPLSVIRYRAWTTDTVRQPDRVIAGPRTGLCESSAIARGPRGEIYVLNHMPMTSTRVPGQTPLASVWSSWVTVYDSSASGDAAPLRTLRIHTIGLSHPTNIAVDRDGELYVTSEVNWYQDTGSATEMRTDRGGAIRVYRRGAQGEEQPVRIIQGRQTGLAGPAAIAFGREGQMYVSQSAGDSSGLVATFRRGAAGTDSPSARLSGPRTGLRRPTSVAFGPGDTLYVLNPAPAGLQCHGRHGTPQPSTVTVYAPDAKGNVEPVRTLAVTQGGFNGRPIFSPVADFDLAVDASGRIQVWHPSGSVIYPPGAEGAAVPSHRIKDEPPAREFRAAVDAGDDGWVYELRVPRRLMCI